MNIQCVLNVMLTLRKMELYNDAVLEYLRDLKLNKTTLIYLYES